MVAPAEISSNTFAVRPCVVSDCALHNLKVKKRKIKILLNLISSDIITNLRKFFTSTPLYSACGTHLHSQTSRQEQENRDWAEHKNKVSRVKSGACCR